MSLYTLQQSDTYEVAALVANFSESDQRLKTHGVSQSLVYQQVKELGVPLYPVYLSDDPANSEYEARVGVAFTHFRQQGVKIVAHGDLFLEDIRAYREQHLAQYGMSGIYPVWGRETAVFAREFLGLGFKAIVTCVDTSLLDAAFSGRFYDEAFLDELPEDVDPCGENGEFHTFVYDGPLFRLPVALDIGETFIQAGRYCICELR